MDNNTQLDNNQLESPLESTEDISQDFQAAHSEAGEEVLDNAENENLEGIIELVPADSSLMDSSSDDEEDSDKTPRNLYEELSAYLFVSTKPVTVTKLAELCEISEDEVRAKVESIIEGMNSANLGFEIIQIQDSYQMRTKISVTRALHKLITPKMKRLSKAAAETLAVIAYKQPVSKAEIEVIRGVDPVPTIKTLLDGKLVRIVGRDDTPGSPALYGTTEHFLERFGLKTLSELPTIREMDLFTDADNQEAQAEDEDLDSDIDGLENDNDTELDTDSNNPDSDQQENSSNLMSSNEQTEKNNESITIN